MEEVEISLLVLLLFRNGWSRGLLFLDGPCRGVEVRAFQTPSMEESSSNALTPKGRPIATPTLVVISPLSACAEVALSRCSIFRHFMILTTPAMQPTMTSSPPNT
jgi:hypothetical protein